jgi:hypothetical protein
MIPSFRRLRSCNDTLRKIPQRALPLCIPVRRDFISRLDNVETSAPRLLWQHQHYDCKRCMFDMTARGVTVKGLKKGNY